MTRSGCIFLAGNILCVYNIAGAVERHRLLLCHLDTAPILLSGYKIFARCGCPQVGEIRLFLANEVAKSFIE